MIVDAVEGTEGGTGFVDQFDGVGTGEEGADEGRAFGVVGTEDGEWVGVAVVDEGLDGAVVHGYSAPIRRSAMATKPPRGMASQAGRLATS